MIQLDAQTDLKIGFPPPLLGRVPLRLPVALTGEGLLALALPGGVLSEAHPFYPGQPSVIAGLRKQFCAGKPELERLGVEVAMAINFVEPEVSGLLLVGITREAVEHWRNVFGSRQLSHAYELIAESRPELPDEFTCELPIARHKQAARMLISHQTGKKSRTHFHRVAQRGKYALWRATTDLPRVHQVRLHAAESGLAIPGERLYGEHPPLTWGVFQGRVPRGGDRVIADRPMVHLARIQGGADFTPVESATDGPLTRLWAKMLD